MAGILASDLLLESLKRHEIHLSLLVADTGLWANPAVHRRLITQTGSAAMSPNVRRARAGETNAQAVDGIRLDNNTYANVAIKRATGLGRTAEGFEACHIWPLTCYDERYHTAIANLLLLPRALAGLSDHDVEIQKALQYRAFELYEWWPEEFDQPVKPEFYPPAWRDPMPDPAQGRPVAPARRAVVNGGPAGVLGEAEREMLAGRLVRWSNKPGLLVHKAIALVVESGDGLPRKLLVDRVQQLTGSPNAYGAVAQLFTAASNGYGRVLVDSNGLVRIHPVLEEHVRSLHWRAG